MKKLMFTAAAAFCGTVFALESANVVGYTEVARPAAFQNSCGGSMFTAVGNDSYSLADLTIAGPTTIANARNNYIMFLQSGTAAKIDKNRTYWYWQGIWRVRTGANPAKDPQLTAEEAANIVVNAGEGFMCNFMHDTTKIMYAGQVITGNENKTFSIARPASYQNFVACNTAASAINLGQITITGPSTIANARNNYIMFLQSGTAAKIDKNRTYWYWQGIWRVRTGANPAKDPQLTAEEAAAINIAAGEGFMCNFMHDTTVLNMPTSL